MTSATAAVLLALTAAQAAAQRPAPAPILPDLPASVRIAGLAGVGVAVPGYAGAIFDNPSASGPIRALSLEGAYARLPDDGWYGTVAGAVRGGAFNLGGGIRYLRNGSSNPVADNVSWMVAPVYRSRGVATGASIHYLSVEDSSGKVYRSLGSDLGFTVAFFDIAAIGLAFHNLARYPLDGPTVDLPASTHLGFSLNLIDTWSQGRLLATVETVWQQGSAHRTVVGLEGGVVVHGVGVVGRVGLGRLPGRSDVGRTSWGASLILGRTRLDYAYQWKSVLGKRLHLFGARWTP